MSSKSGDILFRLGGSLRRTLTSAEKKKSIGLFFLILVNSVVELLGLATIIPVIGAVLDPAGENSELIFSLRSGCEQFFGGLSNSEFIQLLVVAMICGFVMKAVFGLLLVFLQTRFSFGVAYRLQSVLWNFHFGRSLERMRSADSGQLISEITFWPARYINTVLMGVIGLVNDLLVLLLLVVGLLAYDFMVFSSVFVLCVAGSIFIRWLTKTRLESYSGIRKMVDPRMNTTLNNAIRGVLELLAFGAVHHVKDKYMRDAKLGFRVMSNSSVLSAVPARMYELLAALSIAFCILLFVRLEVESGVIETLSLLAIASYRVMPALSRINQKIMGIRGSAFLVDWMDETHLLLEEENRAVSLDAADSFQFAAPDSLRLEKLQLGYAALNAPVIRGLDFEFNATELTSIVGPSGCGKTTLLNAILGLHRPDAGRVLSNAGGVGASCYDGLSGDWLRHLAYLPQHPYLFGGSVRANLDMAGTGTFGDGKLVDLIVSLGLDSVLGDRPLEFNLNEGGSNLSGGQQQRLALVRAFALERPVLILDEATSALDKDSRDVVMDMLRKYAQKGRVVILVTHDKEVAAQCDVVLDLEQHNRYNDHTWS
ncbi:ABC transporter ATP-binding protein/permease [Flavobacteriales bacterium]|nr:ABC transporter ATP-binding protein/permease [Flavobacteriales bacterium]